MAASQRRQLECRVVIRRLPDRRVALGMYDPLNMRYEALGTHGPGESSIDEAVRGLKEAIERAGHRLTFSDCAER